MEGSILVGTYHQLVFLASHHLVCVPALCVPDSAAVSSSIPVGLSARIIQAVDESNTPTRWTSQAKEFNRNPQLMA
jgi:hypothetical protein